MQLSSLLLSFASISFVTAGDLELQGTLSKIVFQSDEGNTLATLDANEVISNKQRLAALEAQDVSTNAAVAAHSAAITSTNAALAAVSASLTTVNASLFSKITAVESSVATLNSQLSTVNSQLSSINSQLATLTSVNSAEDTKIAALETTNAAQDTKINTATNTNNAQDTLLLNVTGDIAVLKTKISSASSIMTSSQISTLAGYGCSIKSRCYQKSVDGTPEKFHLRCNNIGATATVVKTANGYIFGGYNAVSWTSPSNYVSSSSNFLFNLNGYVGKWPCNVYPQYAAYDNSGYGPTFGGGHDLYLSAGSGGNANTHSYGSGYNGPTMIGYSDGSLESGRITEIEVWTC